MEKQKRPWIGFLGMILMLAGVLTCKWPAVGVSAFILGLLVLIFALITGNVTLFG